MAYWFNKKVDMEQKINTIKINGVEYVRKDSVAECEPRGELKIVILQRGWVMVGYMARQGSECNLTKASVIRAWGTTKGLGEIAKGGPTSATKLDKCYGVVEFDYLTVVAMVSCEEKAWVSAL